MPTIQCPHCKHQARVPSLDKIEGKNVKCPSCGQKFYVEPPAPELPNVGSNEFAFRGPAPEFTPPDAPRANPPRRSSKGESLFRPLSYDPNGATSEARYPNLMRYIALSETLNTFLFRLGLVLIVIVIGLVIGEVAAIIQLIQGELEAISGMIFMPLIAALAALSLWLYFILYMAVTEFLRVVVDTENNTRH